MIDFESMERRQKLASGAQNRHRHGGLISPEGLVFVARPA